MNQKLDILLAVLVPAVVLFYLSVAPYSKVEESFNTQATHDILAYGLPLQNVRSYLKRNYDHLTFPGSVPRTFVGPLALAGASWPFAWLVHGVDRQILSRAILGLYNAFSLVSYRNAVQKLFGRETANWYLALQACQFHIMFWSSRTLPNFFAFGLSTYALGFLLPPPVIPQPGTKERTDFVYNQQFGLTLLTILGIVFRSEIAVLLLTHVLFVILFRRLTLLQVIPAGLTGVVIGLSITVPIDSFFWQRFPLWPELTGFAYNVLDSQASNWGESPWHTYFSSSLPKLLFNPITPILLITSLVHPTTSPQTLALAAPNLLFITIYSFIPHKEWRFIIYALPPLTASAARGAHTLFLRANKSSLTQPLALLIPFTILLSFAASFVSLLLSTLNYPGAFAVNQLHAMVHGTKHEINVHMDVLTCMTGFTRFLQIPDPARDGIKLAPPPGGFETRWKYDKTDDEQLLLRPEFWERFDYVLTEDPKRVIGAWQEIGTVKGFDRVSLRKTTEKSGSGTTGDKIDGEENGLAEWGFGEGPWAGFERWVGGDEGLLGRVQDIARKLTGTLGVEMEIKMKDSIKILKRGREPESGP